MLKVIVMTHLFTEYNCTIRNFVGSVVGNWTGNHHWHGVVALRALPQEKVGLSYHKYFNQSFYYFKYFNQY